MAEARFSQDKFSCPICLDCLKNPVTIPCGHSYCMSCITDYWNPEDQMGVYSCPQCRQTFNPMPALYKNTMLAELVEQLKKTEEDPAGDEDVECGVCTGRKHKAIKSCLVCLNSYCQNHLEQHESLFKVKRHNLIDATGRLQEMICHQHDKPLEIYCRTDQRCICMLCMVDEHKNHETGSTAAERPEKQKQLGETQGKFQQHIEEKGKKLQELKEAGSVYQRSAQTAVEESEMIFTELISSIERRRSEVIQMIRDQEKITVGRAERLLKQLQEEIDDLRRRKDELEQLLHTHDHILFLQSFLSLPAPPSSPNFPSITVCSFDEVGKSVSQLRQKLEDFCRVEIENISGQVTCLQIVPTPEYETRNDFLQYFFPFTLDPNTAYQSLSLSTGRREVTYDYIPNEYSDHQDRFDNCPQVLCRESVCGRCYWEVEWNGNDCISISVSYKSISRKGEGDEFRFGCNDQSWSLSCSSSSCSFSHNNITTDLPVVPSSRIGVYVDHSAGILSFYSISDTMTLIHRIQTRFTQPLYPGFGFIYPIITGFQQWLRHLSGKTIKLELCDK